MTQKEIDTSSFLYNNDSIPDYLFSVLPRDCEQGNGVFSQHPPIYILMLSVKDNFVIDNTILKSVESTLNNYFSNIKGFYADRLYFDKIYKDEGENMLNGIFNIWLSDEIFVETCYSFPSRVKRACVKTTFFYRLVSSPTEKPIYKKA
ncbi:MAG: hypothetical protein IPP53_12685 [Bacteroidetes bacterium]|nr:hypothetical protein [Bacteroidota bacterium]